VSRLYSISLFQANGIVGSSVLIVPAGYLWVIRNVDVYVAAPLLSSVDVRMLGTAGQTIWWLTTDADTTQHAQWEGRQVLPSGEHLTFSTTGAADITASGYQLLEP
jgi:hypothetical protein